MGPIKLTQTDKKEVEQNFPGLNCEVANQRIWGTLKFRCRYNFDSGKLERETDHKDAISDDYEIEILFNEPDCFGFPAVYETSNRIRDYAHSKGLQIVDLHVFPKAGNCCLGIFPEYQWESASDFIHQKVIPFFYWQSHTRIKGTEPWKGYSHNSGDTEYLQERLRIKKTTGRNQPCPCGKDKKYKYCCLRHDESIESLITNGRQNIPLLPPPN